MNISTVKTFLIMKKETEYGRFRMAFISGGFSISL